MWASVVWAVLLHDERDNGQVDDAAPWLTALDLANSSTTHFINFSYARGQEFLLVFNGPGTKRVPTFADRAAGYIMQRVFTPLQALEGDRDIGKANLSPQLFVNEALLLLWYADFFLKKIYMYIYYYYYFCACVFFVRLLFF